MAFQYIKSLHIIFIVTWFAGLFYIVRLFVYYSETAQKLEPEKSILQKQYLLMQRRLWYGIAMPSALITAVLGGSLAWQYQSLPSWLIVKLGLVVLLYVYHFICHAIFNQQQQGVIRYTSTQLRVWNEVATVFLVGIVFLVELRDMLSLLWGMVGLVVFVAVLMTAISIYKKMRKE